MQKLETRNGTLVFIEVPENNEKDLDFFLYPWEYKPKDAYEILGEVTKVDVTFDCEPYVSTINSPSVQDKWYFLSLLRHEGIELKEGFKFIVLKEK